MATQIQSGLVATSSIAANEIATSGVITNDINDLAVTNAKLADGAVTGAKISSTTSITCGELTVNGKAGIGTLTVTGAITATGDITAFSSSDKRLKDNITPIEDPLKKVISISGNTYTWNEKSDKEGNDVGVIAQEILEILPEAVIERDNGYLAVDYNKLVPLLIEAVKELSIKVDRLEKLKDEK